MQLTNFNMVGNSVKNAKFKLSQHKVQGQESGLSIFQVAKLMDMIKVGENRTSSDNEIIGFSLN